MISEKCLPILLMIWPGIYSGWFVLWPSLGLPELSNHPGKKSAGLRKFRCRVNPSCSPATAARTVPDRCLLADLTKLALYLNQIHIL